MINHNSIYTNTNIYQILYNTWNLCQLSLSIQIDIFYSSQKINQLTLLTIVALNTFTVNKC